jgi:hypothetical protein
MCVPIQTGTPPMTLAAPLCSRLPREELRQVISLLVRKRFAKIDKPFRIDYCALPNAATEAVLTAQVVLRGIPVHMLGRFRSSDVTESRRFRCCS